MISEEITTKLLDTLKKKAVQDHTQAREIKDKFHTLAGVVEEAQNA
jgi:hypothetical protein